MNPSLKLELIRIESGLTNCIHAVSITKSDLEQLNKLGYSVIPYEWLFDPITLSPTRRISFYVCKDKEKTLRYLRRIEKLERNPSIGNIRKIIKIEGKLLGYPKCCINRFSKLKTEGLSPEKITIIECIENGIFHDVLKGFPDPELPEKAYSLFTSNFYPCKINCNEAVDIGRKLVDYDWRYRYKIVLNILNLLPPIFMVYKRSKAETEFGKIAKSFVESLNELKLIAKDIVEDLMKNPLNFEVKYLKKVLGDMHG